MKRALAAGMLLSLIAAPALAAQSPLDAVATRPELAHAIVSGEVYDLDTGRVLYARNPQTLMEAASTTKLVTTGTALSILGPNFRWTTNVYRTGPVDAAGTLHGDVVLVASGDPNLSQRIQPDGTLAFENEDHIYGGSLDTRAVPGDPLAVLREFATQISTQAGIKHVDGNVVVDTSLFPNQPPEAGTGTVVSPIIINDNVIDVTLKGGAQPGDPVTIALSPDIGYVKVVDKMKTSASDANYEPSWNDTRNPDGTRTLTMSGTVPAGKSILDDYPIPEPKVFAQMAFTAVLDQAGVTVTPPAGAPAPVETNASPAYKDVNRIAQHVSPPFSEDVKVTLKVSHNTHAALMPFTWAIYGPAQAKGDFLKTAFAQERALLTKAGLPVTSAVQQDGLGGHAFFTPDFMVHYLAWAAKQPWFGVMRKGLPILGVDGTLYNVQNGSPADGKVFAKTGSWGSADLLNDRGLVTKGLAGYTTTRSGHHVAFAFWINRMPGKSSLDVNKDATHHAGELLGEMAADTYLKY
ncbi:MAG TPA: D-alanyl-D-alanine carboxypeptidase/D-alanyl-D-alanine-endopeptidase [Candidatus Aquilonibacter sp.]|nr:D-alanyl-D-alanine carboxypeptidase/D-alanyl-D-alanine-endopeptidase [Candidatus Aquilonibacter sp.]